MVRKTHDSMVSLLGFSFTPDSFHLLPLPIVLVSVQGSSFSFSLLGHFFLLNGYSTFWVFVPSLLCSDVKKFTFFWTDRDGSCTCTRKRFRICDLSNWTEARRGEKGGNECCRIWERKMWKIWRRKEYSRKRRVSFRTMTQKTPKPVLISPSMAGRR